MLKATLTIAISFGLGYTAAVLMHDITKPAATKTVILEQEAEQSPLDKLVVQERTRHSDQDFELDEGTPNKNTEVIIKKIVSQHPEQGEQTVEVEKIIVTESDSGNTDLASGISVNPVVKAIDAASEQVANLHILERKILCANEECQITIALTGDEEQFIDAYTEQLTSANWHLLKVNVVQQAKRKSLAFHVQRTAS
ncbi:hypothetical protein [Simiduia aestuariiviva]|uniref:Uncharacterized protein n=1 Tax=Simiduia aestuariiviva TaxID=1510459 RepID=A0A839UMX2_9GAMM|nr:hypothetical protein [Simiduia aestuariiviva]MBB3167899.1 hypothetical protein [Simiduia aestuariiviva]